MSEDIVVENTTYYLLRNLEQLSSSAQLELGEFLLLNKKSERFNRVYKRIKELLDYAFNPNNRGTISRPPPSFGGAPLPVYLLYHAFQFKKPVTSREYENLVSKINAIEQAEDIEEVKSHVEYLRDRFHSLGKGVIDRLRGIKDGLRETRIY